MVVLAASRDEHVAGAGRRRGRGRRAVAPSRRRRRRGRRRRRRFTVRPAPRGRRRGRRGDRDGVQAERGGEQRAQRETERLFHVSISLSSRDSRKDGAFRLFQYTMKMFFVKRARRGPRTRPPFYSRAGAFGLGERERPGEMRARRVPCRYGLEKSALPSRASSCSGGERRISFHGCLPTSERPSRVTEARRRGIALRDMTDARAAGPRAR